MLEGEDRSRKNKPINKVSFTTWAELNYVQQVAEDSQETAMVLTHSGCVWTKHLEPQTHTTTMQDSMQQEVMPEAIRKAVKNCTLYYICLFYFFLKAVVTKQFPAKDQWIIILFCKLVCRHTQYLQSWPYRNIVNDLIFMWFSLLGVVFLFYCSHNLRTTSFRHPVTGQISPENTEYTLQDRWAGHCTACIHVSRWMIVGL